MAISSHRICLSIALAGSALLAACSNSGFGQRDHAFTTHAFVTSAANIDEDAAVRKGIDQIIQRGIEAGLVIEETSDRRVTLTSTTATPGASTDSAGAIEDTRRVVARGEFRTTSAGISYDYHISLRGSRPKHTTEAHERNVVAGLFMVRQVFERPLDVDLDQIRSTR